MYRVIIFLATLLLFGCSAGVDIGQTSPSIECVTPFYPTPSPWVSSDGAAFLAPFVAPANGQNWSYELSTDDSSAATAVEVSVRQQGPDLPATPSAFSALSHVPGDQTFALGALIIDKPSFQTHILRAENLEKIWGTPTRAIRLVIQSPQSVPPDAAALWVLDLPHVYGCKAGES